MMERHKTIFERTSDSGRSGQTFHEHPTGEWCLCNWAEVSGWGGVDHDITVPSSAYFDFAYLLLLQITEAGIEISLREIQEKLGAAGHTIRMTHGDSF